MRTLCASTLIGEFFVIGFAGLVAMKHPDLSMGTVWTVSGIAMFLCLLLCGLVTRPGGIAFGWALQAALIASGFIVPTMFFLGAVFAALWWASVHYGRKIDEAKARFAAQESDAPPSGASAPSSSTPGSSTPDAV
ncbi:DUF4233 domain-containing protein [Streptomyces gilvus]|uniref:DUF4233 domain-containing protein n=1 Tax=Streptomyces gilvus TaxID=2920937 RepID=UPI001F100477|nr:DUF4233 domain-containing protein [Streptomyces sp. CME 23]MCH5676540.1 DUF4233 domain-containing protein [Streptomyces sp. CME 23]